MPAEIRTVSLNPLNLNRIMPAEGEMNNNALKITINNKTKNNFSLHKLGGKNGRKYIRTNLENGKNSFKCN